MKNKNKALMYGVLVGVVFSILAILLISKESLRQQEQANNSEDAGVLTLYTSRKEQLIKPLIAQFEEKFNVKVQILSAKAPQLISRLELEGQKTEADVLLTTDLANLVVAEKKGFFHAVSSAEIMARIPAKYRDAEGRWFGLSKRTRAVFYNKDAVKPSELSSYFNVAGEHWREKLLIRSSDNVYNQSLFAAIIANLGEEKASIWAENIVKNMARQPSGGDTDQLRAVAAGEGDIAIANHYYYYRLKNSSKAKDREVASKLGVFLPNQLPSINANDGLDGGLDEGSVAGASGLGEFVASHALDGAHVNISGAGVLSYSNNRFFAIKLIEFLASKEAQEYYAKVNYEFPVNPEAAIPSDLSELGIFKEDATSYKKIADKLPDAVLLFDKAGWK